MAYKDYKDLIAWQKAMELVKDVYQVADDFPEKESFSLTSQIKRAVISVPSNIAEGEGRKSKKEFSRFLSISHGSLKETETQLLIAEMLNYTTKAKISSALNLCTELSKIINSLIKYNIQNS